MPKKKSRSINSYEKPKTVKVAAPFPYKRVRIDWIDIITETVRIFAGYDIEDDGSIAFSERSVFPTSCVKKITKIH